MGRKKLHSPNQPILRVNDLVNQEPNIKPKEREEFFKNQIKPQVVVRGKDPYSCQCGNKDLCRIVKEKYQEYIEEDDYVTKHYFRMIDLESIPNLKISDINLLKRLSNLIPNIANWVKENKDASFNNLMKRSFPAEEIKTLSKIFKIEQKEIQHLNPENKEIFINFLKNCSNIRITTNEMCFLVQIKRAFSKNQVEYTSSYLKEIINNIQEKINISYYPFKIENLTVMEFYCFLPIISKECKREYIIMFINAILNGSNNIILESWEEMCTRQLLINIIKKFNLSAYLFHELSKKNMNINIEFKVNGRNFFNFAVTPHFFPEIPIEYEGLHKEIFLKFKEFKDKKNEPGIVEEIRQYLNDDKFKKEENNIYYQILFCNLIIILEKDNITEMIIKEADKYPFKNSFNSNTKKLIHDKKVDDRKDEQLNQMITGCKRKFEEQSSPIRNVLQKTDIDKDVRDVLQKSLETLKSKIILEELNENPLIPCVISGEYYSPCDFYTLNCGHKILKIFAKDMKGLCPVCRRKITHYGDTVVSNQNEDLISEIDSKF